MQIPTMEVGSDTQGQGQDQEGADTQGQGQGGKNRPSRVSFPAVGIFSCPVGWLLWTIHMSLVDF